MEKLDNQLSDFSSKMASDAKPSSTFFSSGSSAPTLVDQALSTLLDNKPSELKKSVSKFVNMFVEKTCPELSINLSQGDRSNPLFQCAQLVGSALGINSPLTTIKIDKPILADSKGLAAKIGLFHNASRNEVSSKPTLNTSYYPGLFDAPAQRRLLDVIVCSTTEVDVIEEENLAAHTKAAILKNLKFREKR